ncbi:MAG: four helix bundle protein [Candidatus Omnitrophica bacterium]|nr:four helix bundle protein [Candidatus Omnitrophota bacterium]
MSDFEFDFEKLKVYQKSLDFIDEVFVIYKSLVQDYKFSIGSNLIRAALSIANNIAEGNDKYSSKERVRYFEISSDSARECVSVLNILKRQKLINDNKYFILRKNAREITSMIHGLATRD